MTPDNYLQLLAAFVAAASGAMLPRSSLLRAVVLGLRRQPAAFQAAASLAANRAPEVAALRAVLKTQLPRQRVLVTGSKGVGEWLER